MNTLLVGRFAGGVISQIVRAKRAYQEFVEALLGRS